MNFVRIGSFVINLDAIAYWEEITVAGMNSDHWTWRLITRLISSLVHTENTLR